ncbi:MAG: hypothetical protein ACRDSR_27690 [Pseudonocardiaceae bacterium]
MKARELYTLLCSGISPEEAKLNESQFVKLVERLAEPERDHGELNDDFFLDHIKQSPIRDAFSFSVNKRRIDTHVSDPATRYPSTAGSVFGKHLRGPEKPDLSYDNLRTIMERIVASGIVENEFDDAVRAAAGNFDPRESGIPLGRDLNADVQLLVHHLLKYQSFNLGQLKREDEASKKENLFRLIELEKSKMMITRGPYRDRDLILPPTPDPGNPGSLQHAMPALIDLNRPLPKSSFGGETYKAVFKLAHDLFRRAHDAALEQPPPAQGEIPKEDYGRLIGGQRKKFNSALFSLLPEMEPSSIGPGMGKKYLVDRLGFRFREGEGDEDEGSFEEESSEEEGGGPSEGSEEEFYSSADPLPRAAVKRSTFLNSLGLFSKMSAQKQILDPDTPQNRVKHARLRRRIGQKAASYQKRYDERFNFIATEHTYSQKSRAGVLAEKEKRENELELLRQFRDNTAKIEKIKEKLKGIPDGSPCHAEVAEFLRSFGKERATSGKFKSGLAGLKEAIRPLIDDRILSLEHSLSRVDLLLVELDEYYAGKNVGELLKDKTGRGRKHRLEEFFGRLGPKTLPKYLDGESGGEAGPSDRKKRRTTTTS